MTITQRLSRRQTLLQCLVSQAITLLRNFYDKAGQSEFNEKKLLFIQKKAGPHIDLGAPETMKEEYKGMRELGTGGVTGLLETILSDFQRLSKNTQQDEDDAVSAHNKFKTETEVSVSSKTTELNYAKGQLAENKGLLTTAKEDLVDTEKELDAAVAYYNDVLNGKCVDPGVDFAVRHQQRQDEIEALKEALEILQPPETF